MFFFRRAITLTDQSGQVTEEPQFCAEMRPRAGEHVVQIVTAEQPQWYAYEEPIRHTLD